MPSIKSGFCWICNGTYNCGLRMARDRLVILRWTGNDWKLFGHFFDFVVVGCGGVKCKVKLEPLGNILSPSIKSTFGLGWLRIGWG